MPSPCANGCPFFGTPQTDNLCSACFRLAHRARAAPPCASSTAPAPPPLSQPLATASAASPSAQQPPSDMSGSSATAAVLASSPTPTSATTATGTATGVVTTSSASASAAELPVASDAATTATATNDLPAAVSVLSQEEERPRMASVAPNRCATCRKKLGLTPFICRCAKPFCSVHRHSIAHGCEFDYKAHHRHNLARQNPTVVAKKLDKI